MQRFIVSTSIFFLSLLGIIFFVSPVRAFTLSPLRYTAVVDPGKTVVVPLEVVNTEQETIHLTPEIDAFSMSPSTGHALFGKGDIAKSWVTPRVNELTLAPGEKAVMQFVVSVPRDTAVVSHYLGLFLKQKSEGGQVGLGKRIGTLLFLHISGPVNEKLQLQDFSFEKKHGQSFFDIQTLNTGSIHVIPKGNILLSNWWGKTIAVIPVNTEERKVLPGDVWRMQVEQTHIAPWYIGPIRATLDLKYGLTEQKTQSVLEFWYMPWWSFVGLCIIIFVILGSIFLKKKV